MKDIELIRACLGECSSCDMDHEELLIIAAVCKENGISQSEFESWYGKTCTVKPAIMQKQWDSIRGNKANPAGIGSLIHIVRSHGGNPPFCKQVIADEDYELGWNDFIGRDIPQIVVDPSQAAAAMPEALFEDKPRKALSAYLNALFQGDEYVGLVTEAWRPEDDPDARWLPKKGEFSRTQAELVQDLAKAKDLGEVIGDWEKEAGAWIRFNPLDGKGVSDINVTAYRHALVECDNIPVPQQLAIIQELQLPVAALVESAGKSLHAIVKIEARDLTEYQERVKFLYDVCEKNGLVIDRKNRNPSRLSRLPGATRNGKIQYLRGLGLGQPSWDEWADFIAAVNDTLPEVECLADFMKDPPPLSPALIDGVLRRGHKMLVAGPSKAGKSLLLMQLATAIASGTKWLGWECAKGRVLYVNLELDRASAYDRLIQIMKERGIDPAYATNIDVWNLRGKASPMTDLAPRLIRRALKRKAKGKPYVAIIIDPIYKVITGDENSAAEMAHFCNCFDRVCHELDAATIYCHHHSKGEQGHKRAHDRASGSGVFARDPDALLDLIELDINQDLRAKILAQWRSDALRGLIDGTDEINPDKLLEAAVRLGLRDPASRLWQECGIASESVTGWRMEGILREFPGFRPKRFLFRYPMHYLDEAGLLSKSKADGELAGKYKREAAIKENWETIDAETIDAFNALQANPGDPVPLNELASYLDKTPQAIKDRIRKGAKRKLGLRYDKAMIYRNETEPTNGPDTEEAF